MLIARWHVEARFGHKQAVIDLMRNWEDTIGRRAGIAKGAARLLTGSIGAREAVVQSEFTLADLAELDRIFSAIGKDPEHAAWGKTLEPLVVSGSTYWEIYRLLA